MSIVAAVATEVDRRRPRPLQRRRSDAKCFGQSTSETDAKSPKIFLRPHAAGGEKLVDAI